MDKIDRMIAVLVSQGYQVVIHGADAHGERSCHLDKDNFTIVIWGDESYQTKKLEECYEIICRKPYQLADYRAIA